MTFVPSEISQELWRVPLRTGFRSQASLPYKGDTQKDEQDEGRTGRGDPDRFHIVHKCPADVPAREPGYCTDNNKVACFAFGQDDHDHRQEQGGVYNAKEKEKVEQSRREVHRQAKGNGTNRNREGVAQTYLLSLTRIRTKQLIDVVDHEADHRVQTGTKRGGNGPKGTEDKEHEQKQRIDFSDELKQQ